MAETHTIYFQNQYLELSWPERLVVRVASASFYAILTIMTALLLTSDSTQAKWLGILITIFLIDRLVQFFSGEHHINSQTVRLVEGGQALNAAKYFRQDTRRLMEKALSQAEFNNSSSVILFLLEGLSRLSEVGEGLARLDIHRRAFGQAIVEKLKSKQPLSQDAVGQLDPGSRRITELKNIGTFAFQEAIHFGEVTVSPAALFLGLLQMKSQALAEIFAKFNFSEADFHNAIIFGRLARGLGRKMMRGIAAASGRRKFRPRVMNRAWTSRPTPFLDSVSQDLTSLARAGAIGFLIGHEAEYKSTVNILSREERNNALLVGESGVGKGTMIEYLALQIIRDEVPAKLFDRRLMELHIPSVTAGTKTPGEIQDRFERLAKEILVAGNIVLAIPDIHNLRLTSEGINAFEFLESIFSASLIPIVGTTTPQEFRTIIEPDPNFKTLFDVIKVEELSEEEAARFLTYQSYILEAKWKIIISYQAIKRAASLAHRFLRPKPLPVSASDLLGEALAEAKRQKLEVLTEEIVANLVAQKVKVPVGIAREEEAAKLLKLEEKIHSRLVNQEEAVKAVASAMRQYRAGLAREKGPIATFLFIGPTGVGKTELSKVLAEIYFGSEIEMIRFDMIEYQDPKSVWNFIGSPDGQVKGNLTEAVKAKPFSLLLLDEFEKAHSDILELFLPLFDEGRLTDSLGTTIDFSNTIIICTSNAHSELIKEEIEKGTGIAEIGALIKKRLTEYFKPELVNRFDDVIVFRPLTPEEIQQIASLNLKDLARRLEEEQGISVRFEPEVAKVLAELGWDPVFGARPLRGVIRERVRESLAQEILKGNISRGSKVMVKISGEEFVFEKSK